MNLLSLYWVTTTLRIYLQVNELKWTVTQHIHIDLFITYKITHREKRLNVVNKVYTTVILFLLFYPFCK